jgi:hypothetical protein
VAHGEKLELFDLEADPSEATTLNGRHPEKVQQLSRLYAAWLDEMAEPSSGQGKRWTGKVPSESQNERQQRRMERRKERRATRMRPNEDGR